MLTEKDFRRILLDRRVFDDIKSLSEQKDGGGFIVYLTKEGKIERGKPVPKDIILLKSYQETAPKMVEDTARYAFHWSEFAATLLKSYISSLEAITIAKLDNAEAIVLINSELDEQSHEEKVKLTRELGINPSLINLVGRAFDYCILNFLTEIYNNSASVNFTRNSLHLPHANILVIQQSSYIEDINRLGEAMLANTFSPLIPELDKLAKRTYRKIRGAMDLETRTMNLYEV